MGSVAMMRADDVASILIARSDKSFVDAWTLQKLLYYVQAWHVAITDEPLFSEKVKAYMDGPVVPQVRHSRMDRHTRTRASQSVSQIEVPEMASGIIDAVLAKYGGLSGQELSSLTHNEGPWKEARGDLPPDAPSKEEVRVESMATYYRSHSLLCGRRAADLAAGGLWLLHGEPDAVDVEALLDEMVDVSDDSDPWGGASFAEPAS